MALLFGLLLCLACELPAKAAEPVDCERGERERRLFSDPYYPQLDK